MFVDPSGRAGIDRPSIHHFAALEHRKSIRKAKHERQMLLDHQHRGAAFAPCRGQHVGEPVNDGWLQAFSHLIHKKQTRLGDKTKAAASYSRAIAIRPRDDTARNGLARVGG